MKGNAVALAAALVVLVVVTAVVTYLLTKQHATAPQETATMPPTSETPPPSGIGKTESDIIKEMLIARSVVERYIRAVTARDEAAAAKFTCGKQHGGLLWIGAVGRRITVLRVVGINIEPPERASATVEIQVEGKPPSPVTLQKPEGTWCVWL